ncbi:MAG: hypothetical protein JST43_07105 [Bacteroidetes bacterium]|nr:hypothetical protein [Bacteroidota bacterium]
MRNVGLIAVVLLSACSVPKQYALSSSRVQPYETIGFVELAKKYFDKSQSDPAGIEGIYSVTSIVLKKSKGIFSAAEHEKTINQKDHYAQVAVIKDNTRNNREYIEIPMDNHNNASYFVRGEFTTLSEGNILVLKHFEPKGKVLNYAFTYDREKDMLEGIRTETSGHTTYTYKLIFVRLYPKAVAQVK